MFGLRRTLQQVAALPYVIVGGAVEILLVSSRERGRWIVPKGWPKRGASLAESAATEAWEEAGVSGYLASDPIGSYSYRKRMSAGYDAPTGVLVYPLVVTRQSLDWPERTQRRAAWYPLGDAAGVVDDRLLARLLRKESRAGGAALRQFAAEIET